jgi:hypothetical protein
MKASARTMPSFFMSIPVINISGHLTSFLFAVEFILKISAYFNAYSTYSKQIQTIAVML